MGGAVTSARALFAAWWQRYQQWRRRAENPEPLDLPVPPGHVALIYEEFGDPLDVQGRPEWPPAGPTSAYPEANKKKTGDNDEEDDS